MVAITVDDGYSDNYETLFPVLREFQVPATIFLATDYLDTGVLPWPTRISALLTLTTSTMLAVNELGGPLKLQGKLDRERAGRMLRKRLSSLSEPYRSQALDRIQAALGVSDAQVLRPLTWDQVREMQTAGIEFGAHTASHAWLDQIHSNEVDRELALSRLRVQTELNTSCTYFAYPNGNWSPAVRSAVSKAGFSHAFTQDPGANTSKTDKLSLKRLDVPHNECIGTFASRLAGLAI